MTSIDLDDLKVRLKAKGFSKSTTSRSKIAMEQVLRMGLNPDSTPEEELMATVSDSNMRADLRRCLVVWHGTEVARTRWPLLFRCAVAICEDDFRWKITSKFTAAELSSELSTIPHVPPTVTAERLQAGCDGAKASVSHLGFD